ncbi:hypothetical protein BDB00DRAFT_826871 [Zychaea mexicana]|uniref:uncharacterized protein n=1 Tax=Zychaea mexicana TaxID=64656 RepID=UPI0022FEA54B|nr:uncharacterized protein BDB00DRAFT_826871 [Zychaea mexicana]KAI9492713.1 hypothetical protein BDB00DRAFT_826871 [Zychaea mexicana]
MNYWFFLVLLMTYNRLLSLCYGYLSLVLQNVGFVTLSIVCDTVFLGKCRQFDMLSINVNFKNKRGAGSLAPLTNKRTENRQPAEWKTRAV